MSQLYDYDPTEAFLKVAARDPDLAAALEMIALLRDLFETLERRITNLADRVRELEREP
jgi:hypothetical protein